MKINTLVENTTISPEYRSKHGLCFYIETFKHKILFDLGPSKLFLENAMRMNIDISTIDTVIISHGHKDHGGALKLFLKNNSRAKIYIRESAFLPYYTKIFNIPVFVGLDRSLYGNKQIILTGERIIIDEELQLFSDITDRICYSTSNSVLYVKNGRSYLHDTFVHEQNLIITENSKTVLFAGCAHNGIVNIQKKAEGIAGDKMTYAVSGFHLYNPVSKKCENENLITEIAQRLSKNDTKYYTCHCTGKKAFCIMKSVMGEKINYLSAGASIEI